jgi:two-component system chemotaxis sensor kinase CheA
VRFFPADTELFQDNADFAHCLNDLFRAVHTFKGDFAQYGFIGASRELHRFEDGLAAVVSRGAAAV